MEFGKKIKYKEHSSHFRFNEIRESLTMEVSALNDIQGVISVKGLH